MMVIFCNRRRIASAVPPPAHARSHGRPPPSSLRSVRIAFFFWYPAITTSMLSSRSACVHYGASAAHRAQRRLIYNVCQLRSGGSGSHTGYRVEIHIVRSLDLFCMYLQYRLTSLQDPAAPPVRGGQSVPDGSAPDPAIPDGWWPPRIITPLFPSKPSISVSS